MARCNFCSKRVERGTGTVLVKKDGQITNFCSSKCEKNLLKLKHKPRTTTWTQEYVNVKKGKKA